MNNSSIYDQIGSWPLGPIPILCSLLSIVTIIWNMKNPIGWKSHKGSVILCEYGLAGVCSLFVLFLLSIALGLSNIEYNTPLTYLVSIITFVVSAELIDRMLKFRLGSAPIAEVTRKRFVTNPPDNNFYAALGGWAGVLVFSALFLFLPGREYAANLSPSRIDFLFGSHHYIFGFGWVFAMQGALLHLVILTSIRLFKGA